MESMNSSEVVGSNLQSGSSEQPDAKHFHLSSLFLHRKLSADIPELFREMKRRGLTTSLDTNDDPEDKWAGVLEDVLPLVDVLLCTESELAKMAKAEPAGERMSAKVPLLVVKRGAAGASAYFEGRRIDVPSLRVEVKDSVGAGDTFDAGFLHKWVRETPLETCIAYGNLAGGLSVTRSGGTEAFCDKDIPRKLFPTTLAAGKACAVRFGDSIHLEGCD